MQVSFSMLASGERRTAFLCVLSVLVLAVLTINRMASAPPFLWVIGMNSCIGFGIAVIVGQAAPSHAWVWRTVR